MWARRQTHARRRTEFPCPPVSSHVRKRKRARVRGASTPTRPIRRSRHRNATRAVFAMVRALRSMQKVVCSLPNMVATSCFRTGRVSIRPSRVRRCRLKNCSFSPQEQTTVGRNATTINCRRSWCSLLNMAAMGARPWASVPTGGVPSLLFQDIGRPIIWRSIMATSFRRAIAAAPFIAFHGSWNRAPLPQGGYNVVFQPLADGKASGPFVVFADGFAGAHKDPGQAAFRPTGLAEAPDGALYVADDVHGRIWRVTYNGDGSDKVAAAPAAIVAADASTSAVPPEGIHPDAGRSTRPLPTPPGATPAEVALGDRIFHGEASDGTCSGCHGSDAAGTPQGPPLNRDHWLWGDGSLAALSATIEQGVPHPKQYQGVMPPLGGSPLSKQDLAAVSAYVWALGHASLN